MKCPKCHYLSFEPEARCRNCGYDLDLADADLTMREFESDDDVTSPADLPLRADSASPEETVETADAAEVGAPRSLFRDRPRAGADPPSSGATILDLPPRPRPVRRPRPVPSQVPSHISSQPPRTRTTAAAARMAALDAPAQISDVDPLEDPLDVIAPAPLESESTDTGSRAASAADLMPAGLKEKEMERGRSISESTSRVPTSELPLFVKGLPENPPPGMLSPLSDEALIGMVSTSRPPLGVNRRVSEPAAPSIVPTEPVIATELEAAPAPMRRMGAFDADIIGDLDRLEQHDVQQARAEARALVRAAQIRESGDAASPVLRLAAAIVDLAVLSSLAVAIVALTLRICGLSFAEFSILPIVPLAGFLLLVAVGYLLLFSIANGQTLGKMMFGLRSVGEAGEPNQREPMTIEQAASRALLTIPSVLVLGLGFVPALFGDRRAVHDRLAHTRVVRA